MNSGRREYNQPKLTIEGVTLHQSALPEILITESPDNADYITIAQCAKTNTGESVQIVRLQKETIEGLIVALKAQQPPATIEKLPGGFDISDFNDRLGMD